MKTFTFGPITYSKLKKTIHFDVVKKRRIFVSESKKHNNSLFYDKNQA